MRTTILLVVAALGACGSSSDDTGDLAVGDLSTGDLAVATSCDFVAQTGCAAGEKCAFTVVGTPPAAVAFKGVCQPNGSVAEGQACTKNADGTDDCAAGLLCARAAPQTVPPTTVCRKLCDSDATCSTAGQKCALFDVMTNTVIGRCLPTCTPFGNDCPGGQVCSVPFDESGTNPTVELVVFACLAPGTGAAYSICHANTDCGGGMYCLGTAGAASGTCTPLCDGAHACPPTGLDGGAGSCEAHWSNTNGVGFCFGSL